MNILKGLPKPDLNLFFFFFISVFTRTKNNGLSISLFLSRKLHKLSRFLQSNLLHKTLSFHLRLTKWVSSLILCMWSGCTFVLYVWSTQTKLESMCASVCWNISEDFNGSQCAGSSPWSLWNIPQISRRGFSTVVGRCDATGPLAETFDYMVHVDKGAFIMANLLIFFKVQKSIFHNLKTEYWQNLTTFA